MSGSTPRAASSGSGAAAGAGDGSDALPRALTLNEAVARFRRGGFDLLIADADVQAADADVAIASAVANPSATAGVIHSFFNDGAFETHNGWQLGVSDSNAIIDALAGKRSLRKRIARTALAAARLRRSDVERTLESVVKSQFASAAAAEAILNVTREIRDSADRTYALNSVRFQRGAISEVELLRTETAKLEADQAVDAAAQSVMQSKVSLAFLIGQRTPSVQYDVDPAEIRFRVPSFLVNADAGRLLGRALSARPDLLMARQQQERAAAGAALARRSRFPDIGVAVQYSQEGSANTPPGGPQAIAPPTVLLTLTGSLPLFYQQQGEIRRAEADLTTQGALSAKTEAQVVADVTSAFAGYETARALVARMEDRLLERSRRARDLTEVQYRKGAASLLEYLDAQRTYSAVSAEYWQDLAAYWNAVFQLEAASATELSS